MTMEELITIEEAAELRGCSPGYLRRKYRAGEIKGGRAGARLILLDRASVLALKFTRPGAKSGKDRGSEGK